MAVPAVVKATPVEKPPQTTATPASQKAASNGSVGVKIPTTNLVMHEDFKCRIGELYDVFVNINVRFFFLFKFKSTFFYIWMKFEF